MPDGESDNNAAHFAFVACSDSGTYLPGRPRLCVAKIEKADGEAKSSGQVDPDISPSKILSGAMGIAVALAWNDAVKSIINRIYPGGGQTALVLYAIFVTIFVIAVVWAINAGNKIVQNVSDVRKGKLTNYDRYTPNTPCTYRGSRRS